MAGKRIGTIRRLVIEKVSGHVVYAVTAFGGSLGAGAEIHTIPWQRLRYETAVGGYRTNITESQLQNAPEAEGINRTVCPTPAARGTNGAMIQASILSWQGGSF